MFAKFRNIVKDFVIIYLCPIYRWFLVRRLRRKERINVVFFAMSLPMWRHQHLYEKMVRHPKFNPTIVILPTHVYSSHQQTLDVKALREHFDNRGIPYMLGMCDDGRVCDVKDLLAPDVLFYPQPYWGYYIDELAYNKFYGRLLCYVPYAFWTSKDGWSYAQGLHKMAWKLFYSTELHRKDAICYSPVKDVNVEIVGYPTADDFLSLNHSDIWKKQKSNKKKIIWAPHFTIVSGGNLTQSNFLWMADLMLDIARKYHDKVQFVFKPHPRLYTELVKHPDWGESRAAEYYHFWEAMENTQIETGEFIDLFMTSDAMIHDCGSFSVEYHYSGNPVMYVATDFERQLDEKNDFGKLAMNQHYVGRKKEDIIEFIESVVLGGNDPMKEGRAQFKKDYLLPPNGKSVADNIMDVFLKTFC